MILVLCATHQSQESLRKTRKEYATNSIKNHLSILLFVIESINKMTTYYNSTTEQKSVFYTKIVGEKERLSRVVHNLKSTITYSSDTLDPILVDQLDVICTFVGQSDINEKEDGKLEYPKYEKSKQKVDQAIKKLAEIQAPD